MMIGDAINGGGRDVDQAFDTRLIRRFDDVARADDIGGVNVFLGIQRQRRCRMHDDVHARHGAVQGSAVANIGLEKSDAVALWIVKVGDVVADNLMTFVQQIAGQVNPQKPEPPVIRYFMSVASSLLRRLLCRRI